MNPNQLGLVADTLLFLSALLLLIDLAPHDFLPKSVRQKNALHRLREARDILFDVPSGVTITPKRQDGNMVRDDIHGRVLVDLIRKRSPLARTIPWKRAVGVGFSVLSLPVGRLSLPAFHPLYISLDPGPGNQELELVPVGQLEDIDRWLSERRQSSLTLISAVVLAVGFLLQLIVRLNPPT